MNMRNKTLALIVIIAALLVLNFFSEMFFFRIDLTEDRQYTLSNATRHILKNLDTTVSVTAYFSENLPPDFIRAKKDFEDLLIEYNRLSGGKMEYRFIAPGKDPKIEDEAIQAGIQPVMINVREKDQMKQQKAFLGAVLQLGENKDAIPFIQPGAALEYALSTAIKKISVADKPFIGFLTGQGEPEISHMAQVYGVLSPLYNIEPVALTDTAPVPDRFKTLVIVAPTDSFSQPQLSQLDRFLQQGGNILVAINRVSGNFQTLYGAEINTGLEQWLRSKGITVENSFLIDARCGTVALQQQQGMFSFTTNISFPYLPVISSFASHPVVKGIEGVMLTFASPAHSPPSRSRPIALQCSMPRSLSMCSASGPISISRSPASPWQACSSIPNLPAPSLKYSSLAMAILPSTVPSNHASSSSPTMSISWSMPSNGSPTSQGSSSSAPKAFSSVRSSP
jgi:gliding-associated putative ABC transporter substrate-binding component GldG